MVARSAKICHRDKLRLSFFSYFKTRTVIRRRSVSITCDRLAHLFWPLLIFCLFRFAFTLAYSNSQHLTLCTAMRHNNGAACYG